MAERSRSRGLARPETCRNWKTYPPKMLDYLYVKNILNSDNWLVFKTNLVSLSHLIGVSLSRFKIFFVYNKTVNDWSLQKAYRMFFLTETWNVLLSGTFAIILIPRGLRNCFCPRSKSFSLVLKTSFRLLLAKSPVLVEYSSTIGIAVDFRVSFS